MLTLVYRNTFLFLFAAILLLAPLAAFSWGDESSSELARQGVAIAKQYCYRCHGESFNGNAQFNVLDRESLLDEGTGYVVAGDADESAMWQRIVDGDMPPEEFPSPSDAEKEILRKWIAAGSPFPKRDVREHRYEEDVLAVILSDLQQLASADRPYLRYFSLAHLHNNTSRVTDFDLRLYRAALSKSLNSLSWEPTIVTPTSIDEEQIIYRIDLRDYGFDRNDLWGKLLAAYPYGLKFNNVPDRAVVELDQQVEAMAGTKLAYLRADWFITNATRPPLYHQILQIPSTDAPLEQDLRVDVAHNFNRNRLQRAGFSESGVSVSNRLVERHSSAYGYYWKSYDFAQQKAPTSNLFKFPLGPKFDGNPHTSFAFSHDGGELIFSLPNGLQAYMLVDSEGNRIDEGPISVVRDLKEISGSPVVVNGLSCMHCHQHGMIRFKDSVRDGVAIFGAARKKVMDLYPEQVEMDKLVQADSQKFLASLDAAVSRFLRVADDKDRPVDRFPEPIGAVARFYNRDLTLEDAAFELGIKDPSELKGAIRFNPQLQALGLKPLAAGAAIDRFEWEKVSGLNSAFQFTARILERGTPTVFLDLQ